MEEVVLCNYLDSHCNKTGLFHKEPIEMTTNYNVQVSKWSMHLVYLCPICGGTKNRLLSSEDLLWIGEKVKGV